MPLPYRKILCPIDFDRNSLVALDAAIEFARSTRGVILLLHVVPLVAQVGEVPIPVEVYREQEAAARHKLARVAKRKLRGIRRELMIRTGEIALNILTSAKKNAPDLIVMATHGRKGLKRLFLGSVAEAVLREAACPVLTIRQPR